MFINNSNRLQKLSCDYIQKNQFYTGDTFTIEGWDSVTSYAYSNIVKYNKLNILKIRKNINIREMKDDFKTKFLVQEENTVRKLAITRGFESIYSDTKLRNKLLDTGNKRLIYGNKNAEHLSSMYGETLMTFRTNLKASLIDNWDKQLLTDNELLSEYIYFYIVKNQILNLGNIFKHAEHYYDKTNVKIEFATYIVLTRDKPINAVLQSRGIYFRETIAEIERNRYDDRRLTQMALEYTKLYSTYYNPALILTYVQFQDEKMEIEVKPNLYNKLIVKYKSLLQINDYNQHADRNNIDVDKYSSIKRYMNKKSIEEVEAYTVKHFGISKSNLYNMWKYIDDFKKYHDSGYNQYELVFNLYNRSVFKNPSYVFAPRNTDISDVKLEPVVIYNYIKVLLAKNKLEQTDSNVKIFTELYKDSLHLLSRELYVEYNTGREFIPRWVPSKDGMIKESRNKTFTNKDIQSISNDIDKLYIENYVYDNIDISDHLEKEKNVVMDTYIELFINSHTDFKNGDLNIFKRSNYNLLGKLKETIWDKYINKDVSLNIQSSDRKISVIEIIDTVLTKFRESVIEENSIKNDTKNNIEQSQFLLQKENENLVILHTGHKSRFFLGYITEILCILELYPNYIKRRRSGNVDVGLKNRTDAIKLYNFIGNSLITIGGYKKDMYILPELEVDMSEDEIADMSAILVNSSFSELLYIRIEDEYESFNADYIKNILVDDGFDVKNIEYITDLGYFQVKVSDSDRLIREFNNASGSDGRYTFVVKKIVSSVDLVSMTLIDVIDTGYMKSILTSDGFNVTSIEYNSDLDYFKVSVSDGVRVILEFNDTVINDRYTIIVKSFDSVFNSHIDPIDLYIDGIYKDADFRDSIYKDGEPHILNKTSDKKSRPVYNNDKGVISFKNAKDKHGFMDPSYYTMFEINGLTFPSLEYYIYFRLLTSFKIKLYSDIDTWKKFICTQPDNKTSVKSFVKLSILRSSYKKYRGTVVKKILEKYYTIGIRLKFQDEKLKTLLYNTGKNDLYYITDDIDVGKILQNYRDLIIPVKESDSLYKIPNNKLLMAYLTRICKKWLHDISIIAELRSYQNYEKRFGHPDPRETGMEWGNIKYEDIKFVVKDYIYKIKFYNNIDVDFTPEMFTDIMSGLAVDFSNIKYNKMQMGGILWHMICNVSYELTYNKRGMNYKTMIKDYNAIEGDNVQFNYDNILDTLIRIIIKVTGYIKTLTLTHDIINKCTKLLVVDNISFIDTQLENFMSRFMTGIADIDNEIKTLDEQHEAIIMKPNVGNKIKDRHVLIQQIKKLKNKRKLTLENNIKTEAKEEPNLTELSDRLKAANFNINYSDVLLIHTITMTILDFLECEPIVQRRLKLFK